MPYTNNRTTRIHYQLEGSGPPLVLQHGYTSSIERWYECGYVECLKAHFQLILIDARGHGLSDKPHDAADYDWQKRAADIIAVVDSLGIDKFHFWGYSMGGIYGYKLALLVPHRLMSLVIGGAHPYETSFSAFDGIDGKDEAAFVTAMENLLGEKFTAESNRRMLKNDLPAMIAAAGDRPSLANDLVGSELPWFFYVGANDLRCAAIEGFSRELKNAELLKVPAMNHAEMMAAGKVVVPRVTEFLHQK
ncbi:MAG: pimeloyl-ACP methyl ester carboxylesterase [Planctomycetota bacterium]|jgi:pimeloyl-ACP methyl ester carboxylesterase